MTDEQKRAYQRELEKAGFAAETKNGTRIYVGPPVRVATRKKEKEKNGVASRLKAFLLLR